MNILHWRLGCAPRREPLSREGRKSEAVYEDGVIFSPRKKFKNKKERMCTYEMCWHMYARQRRMGHKYSLGSVTEIRYSTTISWPKS